MTCSACKHPGKCYCCCCWPASSPRTASDSAGKAVRVPRVNCTALFMRVDSEAKRPVCVWTYAYVCMCVGTSLWGCIHVYVYVHVYAYVQRRVIGLQHWETPHQSYLFCVDTLISRNMFMEKQYTPDRWLWQCLHRTCWSCQSVTSIDSNSNTLRMACIHMCMHTRMHMRI